MGWRWLILLVLPCGVLADSVVPTRTIRANAIIEQTDVTVRPGTVENGFSSPQEVVGLEARVVLYAGRVIRAGDVGPPAVVARNQVVRLAFNSGGLSIITEGRALERAGVGDSVRIMNLSSRATIIGKVLADGSVHVGP